MLTIDQRLSYGVGDFGINLYFMSVMSYLLFFYTEVYGISASVAAGVFFVARLVDAISDPLMGYLADRTRSRWGRFRPYLFWGPIPLALITVATFTVPDFDEFGKVLWAYLTYTAFGIIYTVVTIPYAGMTSALTMKSSIIYLRLLVRLIRLLYLPALENGYLLKHSKT